MLTLRRRDPMLRWRNTAPEFRDMQQLFDTFLSEMNEAPVRQGDLATPWVPPVDIVENDDEFRFQLELPGLKLEDIKLTLEGDYLVVEGERKWTHNEDKDRIHRKERYYGAFRRELRLPPKVDPDKIEAKFKEGILEIHMPVLEIAKPRVLEVQHA